MCIQPLDLIVTLMLCVIIFPEQVISLRIFWEANPGSHAENDSENFKSIFQVEVTPKIPEWMEKEPGGVTRLQDLA
jgi:hypothetical protein